MKWHENKSCLIRFDCSHIENQGRKIINFFGISRIQIRTKIRLDRKRSELDYILVIRRRSYFGFLKFQNFSICPQCKISKIWDRRTKTFPRPNRTGTSESFEISDRNGNSAKFETSDQTEVRSPNQYQQKLGPDQDYFFFQNLGPLWTDRSLSIPV